MIKVVRALPEDYKDVVAMALEAWKETGSPVDASHSAVASLVSAIATNGILQVAKEDDSTVGFAAAALTGLLVNPKAMCATSLAVFVKPDNRGRGIGRKLRRQMALVARQKRATYMCVPSTPYPVEAL